MITKNELKNKRAQIGLTLTWFVAFIVVFVIIAVYILTVVMVSTKDLHSTELKLEENSRDLKFLENQRKIEYLLNVPVKINNKQNTVQIKDLIELWLKDDSYKELLEESIKTELDNLEYSYYDPEEEFWEYSIDSLTINKRESSTPAKAIIIQSTNYTEFDDWNQGYYKRYHKSGVDISSCETYFPVSTGESIKVTLLSGGVAIKLF